MHRGFPPRRIVSAVLNAAMLAAPFLAFLFRAEAGLGVMAVALTSTALVLREALTDAPAQLCRVLWLLIAVNLALAGVCMVALAARLAGA